MTKTAAEVLFEAADEIERRGLTKGSFGDLTGFPRNTAEDLSFAMANCRVCALGAINYILSNKHYLGSGETRHPAKIALAKDLGLKVTDKTGAADIVQKISLWNDANLTTAETVAARMRRIATTLNKEEDAT